jgi:hypothetical protein
VSELDTTNIELREIWDRLVLLLFALLRERWEHEARRITRREIHRLAPPDEHEAGHDE